MKKTLLIIVGFIVLVYVVAMLAAIDPDERRPGLKLTGELAAEQNTDWSFLEGRNQIYVQMNTWYGIPHSITTTSWVLDGDLYVPCGRCPTKNWPNHVARDTKVRLKVNGNLYEREAVRVEGEQELRRVMNVAATEPTPEGVWVYRMQAH